MGGVFPIRLCVVVVVVVAVTAWGCNGIKLLAFCCAADVMCVCVLVRAPIATGALYAWIYCVDCYGCTFRTRVTRFGNYARADNSRVQSTRRI